MDSGTGEGESLTPELLADLQAGMLDDATAARLRQRIRTDPQAAQMLTALDQVRRDLAHLGADESSAPDVDPAVSARIATALHAARPAPRLHRIGLVTGLAAIVVAAVVGAVMLVRDPAPTRSTGPTAEKITVSRVPRHMPLSDAEIIDLLSKQPDYGSLADPQRRASCLAGLGYPAKTPILGAKPVDVDDRAGILMVVAADTPQAVTALVVESDCSSAHTGLMGHTVVARP